jgi:hypothetical protein
VDKKTPKSNLIKSFGNPKGMKNKRPPKFKVFSAACPKCGSKKTSLDLLAPENLKRVPLTVLTSR